jgi:hypothetical protein
VPGFNFLRRFTGNAVSTAAGYGIGSAMSPALEPLTREVANETWSAHPNQPLSPDDAADATVRNLLTVEQAAAEAKRNGINADRFETMRGLAGEPPGPAQLLELWNRGDLDEADVTRGLRQGRLRNEWVNAVKALRRYLPPVSDLVRFGVREVYDPEQRAFLDLDADYPEAMTADAAKLGLSERDARRYWAAHWNLPSYTEATEMLHRGFLTRSQYDDLLRAQDYAPTWRGKLRDIAARIPPLSDMIRFAVREVYDPAKRAALGLDAEFPEAFAGQAALHGMSEAHAREYWAAHWHLPSATQGFQMLHRKEIDLAELDGLLKALDYPTLWRDRLRNIAYHVPGRIDLRRMLQEGLITPAEARGGYEHLGYRPADAARMVALAQASGSTTAKGLTAADLAAEYEGLLISRAEYVSELRGLGYPAAAAEEKADVTDSKRARAARNALIATARTRYIGWRIDQPAVEQALRDADVPAAQASDLLARWAVERELNVHHLTEAQVLAAYKKTLLTRDAALERLLDLGLDADDALIRLGDDARNLSVPDIVKAYVTDVITREDALARLVALGFSATDAGIRLDAAKAAGV